MARTSSLYIVGQTNQIGLGPAEYKNIQADGGRQAAHRYVLDCGIAAGSVLCTQDEQGSMVWHLISGDGRLIFRGSRR